ncbi:prolyl oligopeptidase family serine peptidase, partial [Candidatus Amoebophilus asiaticus]|nr:prolyl oligopeptidase family serine peptidase [Candidatus Amoebophilus asiaticus]
MQIIGNIPIPSKHDLSVIVDAFYEQTQKPKPVVFFSHGFKGFKDWGHFNLIASYFAEKEFVFVKFNFSHNGTTLRQPTEFVDLEAFGNNNFSKELDDLGTVIDWILSPDNEYIDRLEIDVNKIYLLGHSRGGGISILKANEDERVKKLVTWSAVNDFEAGWTEETMAVWKKEGVITIENSRTKQSMPLYYQLAEDYHNNQDRLFLPDAVKNLNIPYLIIHGTNDESVPHKQALEMKEWNANAKLLSIEGA